MKISPAVVADLALLTDALDEAGADVLESARRLVADAGAAVPSFLGLSVTVDLGAGPSVVATLETENAADPRSSLTFEVPGSASGGYVPAVVLTFHAAVSGAFVDLSADLAFLTGRPLADFVIDDESDGQPQPAATSLAALSAINQSIGVLIGRGRTAEQAYAELTRRATAAGTNHHGAAELIFRNLGAGSADPNPPAADRPAAMRDEPR